jgi:hypothetical protein
MRVLFFLVAICACQVAATLYTREIAEYDPALDPTASLEIAEYDPALDPTASLEIAEYDPALDPTSVLFPL